MKIGQYLAKIWTKVCGLLFLATLCTEVECAVWYARGRFVSATK